MTPKVTFLIERPSGLESREVAATPGESILDVALNHDIPLQHACGGFCACTTCHVIVQGGPRETLLSPIEEAEDDRMDALDGYTEQSRLGCQAKVVGDVTVKVVNVDD